MRILNIEANHPDWPNYVRNCREILKEERFSWPLPTGHIVAILDPEDEMEERGPSENAFYLSEKLVLSRGESNHVVIPVCRLHVQENGYFYSTEEYFLIYKLDDPSQTKEFRFKVRRWAGVWDCCPDTIIQPTPEELMLSVMMVKTALKARPEQALSVLDALDKMVPGAMSDLREELTRPVEWN